MFSATASISAAEAARTIWCETSSLDSLTLFACWLVCSADVARFDESEFIPTAEVLSSSAPFVTATSSRSVTEIPSHSLPINDFFFCSAVRMPLVAIAIALFSFASSSDPLIEAA